MAVTTKALPGQPGLTHTPHVSRRVAGGLWKFTRTKPLGAASALVAIGLVVVAVAAPLIATHDPREMSVERFQAPGADFWFGSDHLGRDIFSRVVYGSQLSLIISLTAVTIGTVAGTFVGLTSAYIGGRVDLVIQRFVDAMLSFPGLVFAIALVGLVGPSIKNVAIAIGIVTAPSMARIIRGPVFAIKENAYVEAARATGGNSWRVMARHILPNITPLIIVISTSRLGAAILIESGLSFLGLGPSPDTPTWGQMLSGDALYALEIAWWLALFPGLAITLVVLSFNLLGDALRDVMDPHLRGR
ncbi:MAG: ABC transporter permease [Dehalococcoidia bacterium]